MKKTAQSVPLVPTPTPKPPGGWEGWSPYIGNFPFGHSIIEAWHPSWERSEILEPLKMHPMTNVAGLYWRPVAEGGETIN